MTARRPAGPTPPVPPSIRRVFVVDDEPDLLFVARRELASNAPTLTVEAFDDPRAALEALRAQPPDALITDLRMPDLSGIELIWFARQAAPELPIVVVSAYGTPEIRRDIAGRSSMAFVEKPFSAAQLIQALTRASDRAAEPPVEKFQGQVRFSGTIELVQLYALARSSGRLHVVGPEVTGELWFERGEIVHAATGDLVSEDAVREMLGWSGGRFEFAEGEHAPEVTIHGSWQQVLLEACRLLDEKQRSIEATPADGPQDDETSIQTAAPAPQTEGSLEMANVKESLAKLSQTMDGFIGACVVESNSGMMLGAEGGGPINLEVAAAGNTEVVRAKRKTMAATGLKDTIEDILITLGKHYQLIRPMSNKDGLFIYVALERSKASLAMARIQLADIEKDMTI